MSDLFNGAGATIADLDGVKRYFGLDPAESPTALVEAVSTGTGCHAILLIGEGGIALFSTIENDEDAVTATHALEYPFTARDLTTALNAIEEEAEALWRRANLTFRDRMLGQPEDTDEEWAAMPVEIVLVAHPDGNGLYALQMVFGPSGHQFIGRLDDLHRIVREAHRVVHARLRRVDGSARPDPDGRA